MRCAPLGTPESMTQVAPGHSNVPHSPIKLRFFASHRGTERFTAVGLCRDRSDALMGGQEPWALVRGLTPESALRGYEDVG